MATGWATMTSEELGVTDYTIPVTIGSSTASFVFRVGRQPASTRQIASFTATYDRYTLTFQVRDVTDHTLAGSPRSVFGVAFTPAIIMGLRALITSSTTMIPGPGTYISYGSSYSSVVDAVDIAQTHERVTDVFIVTCNLKEPSTSSTTTSDDEKPRMSKTDDIPPWQTPAEVSFEASTTEGMTLGYAFPTTDLEGDQSYSLDDLRASGMATAATMKPVENYAEEPFSSPPQMPKVNGTLHIKKGFLRSASDFSMDVLRGIVNHDEISISELGARFYFPGYTLSPSSLNIVPKIYKREIPWYPKTKHPLKKTYGELFYGYSGSTSNKVAINKTNETIRVYKPLLYLEVSASFAYRVEGFGVWIANRGYMEKDSDAADGKSAIMKDGLLKESWLDESGKVTKEKRIWRGYTMMEGSSQVSSLISKFFPSSGTANISWATTSDNYGATV